MYYLRPFNKQRNEVVKGSDLFDAFFDSFFRDDFFKDGFFPSTSGSEALNMNSFKVDVKETENNYLIEAELPGVDKADIDIAYQNKQLTITAQRDEVLEENKDNYIRKERRSGSFKRSFYMDNIDEDSIQASFDNGVLKIDLAKKLPNLPEVKKIEIQ